MKPETSSRQDGEVDLVAFHANLEEARKLLIQNGFSRYATLNADNPCIEVMAGHAGKIWLVRQCAELSVPEKASKSPEQDVPDHDFKMFLPPLQPSFVCQRKAAQGSEVHQGRVRQMLYRDLIPGRQGGRFIASHITVPKEPSLEDSVHFHKVHFQMIYCWRGWVRLVYQNEGPEFIMRAGDCVLQPPEIRHQVLECSPDGVEVIELSSPAVHWTLYDDDLALPNSDRKVPGEFSGQRFVHHKAMEAEWQPWRIEGFESRDLEIRQASGGVAQANVVRRSAEIPQVYLSHNGEIVFMFVLDGHFTLQSQNQAPAEFEAGDSIVIPGGMHYGLSDASSDLQFLEVALPGDLQFTLGCD